VFTLCSRFVNFCEILGCWWTRS